MTITINLTPEDEAQLQKRATQAGIGPDLVATQILQQVLQRDSMITGRTMADKFAGRIGEVEGTGEAFSENCGERFEDYLFEKQQKGQL